jgi:hypothetical protein
MSGLLRLHTSTFAGFFPVAMVIFVVLNRMRKDR